MKMSFVGYLIVSIGFYFSATICFLVGSMNNSIGIMNLCLGSYFLCMAVISFMKGKK